MQRSAPAYPREFTRTKTVFLSRGYNITPSFNGPTFKLHDLAQFRSIVSRISKYLIKIRLVKDTIEPIALLIFIDGNALSEKLWSSLSLLCCRGGNSRAKTCHAVDGRNAGIVFVVFGC